ncbi:MAG: STAS domain-containing protein [Bdellovibrionota bacterium]
MALSYSMVVQEKMVVVSFKGVMDRSSAPTLEQCTKEILEVSPRGVLLNMVGVENIKSEAYRPFALLGKSLKSARVPYRYVAFGSQLKNFLVNDGLLAYPEVKDTLETGLRDLMESIAAGAH